MSRLFLYLTVLLLLAVHSAKAMNFSSAFDDAQGTIQSLKVARDLLMQESQPFTIDVKKTNSPKVFISVKEAAAFDDSLETAPEEFHIQGKLPRTILASLEKYKAQLDNIPTSINDDLNSTEFIFTGYGHGGKIALALSSLWVHKYTQIKQSAPKPNQIKVITFSASSVGDDEFNDFMKTTLGQLNIIEFSSYFQDATHCGIQIRILPDEQFMESLNNINYDHLRSRIVKRAFIFFLGFKLLDNVYNVYYNPVMSSNNDLLDQPDEKNYYSSSITSPSHNGTCPIEPLNNRGALVTGSASNKLMYPIDSTSSDMNIVIASILFSVFSNLYEEYLYYCFIPSKKLLKRSFLYTQCNYLSIYDKNYENIGCPPLFSIRRGVGKKIGDLLRI